MVDSKKFNQQKKSWSYPNLKFARHSQCEKIPGHNLVTYQIHQSIKILEEKSKKAPVVVMGVFLKAICEGLAS